VEKQFTIAASYIKAMLKQAQQQGVNQALLLADIELDMLALEANEPCSALVYGQLHHRITELAGDDWFGMLSGGSVPPGALKFMCRVAVNAKTLQEAIDTCAEFFELCRGFKVKQTYELRNGEVMTKIAGLSHLPVSEFEGLMLEASPTVLKSSIAAWLGFVSWLIGQEITPNAMYYPFSNDASNGKHRYPVYYDQAFCGCSYDSKYLTMPVIQHQENVDNFLRKAPYYAFNRAAHSSDTLVQKVKTLMSKNIGDKFPQALDVAKQVNMSVTSLHRKLSQEGSSFQKLKDATRMEAAILYLGSPDMSTTAVADMLGFDDPSTFNRSFKKWTGLPPGEYRKKLAVSS
jgi:AraC-like DNA-binding protein